MTAIDEHTRNATRSRDRRVLGGAAVLALLAWLSILLSGNGAVGVVLFAGVFAVLSAAGPGLRLHTDNTAVVPTDATLGERVETLASPGKPVWYLPFLLLPVMLVTAPLAFARSSTDGSIFFLAAACALIGGTLGTVVGSRLWSAVMVAIGVAPKALEETTTDVSPRAGIITSVALSALLLVAAVVGALLV